MRSPSKIPYRLGFVGLRSVHARAINRVLGILLALTLSVRAEGQNTRREPYVVDVVNLKNHKQIRGIVLNPEGTDDVRMAVSREWLRKMDREMYTVADARSTQMEKDALQQFSNRLEKWKETAKNPAVRFLIENELERVKKVIEGNQDDDEKKESQFMVVVFKRATIANAILATAVARNAATWGWSEGLAKMETKGLNELLKELKNNNVDTSKPAPDLSDRFPMQMEDDEKWTIRQGFVAAGFGDTIEFQGSGDVMLQTGTDQKPDVAALMTQMMQSQVNTLLNELAGNTQGAASQATSDSMPKWAKLASKKADESNALHFRATHVSMDMVAETATVDSGFYVKGANGQWNLAWRTTVQENTSQQKVADIKRVTNDPQLEQLIEQLKNFGASESMEKAIAYGAATMSAQNKANDEFTRHVSRFLKQLDKPKL